jgi:tripeptidyl-peptidase-1
MMLLLVHVLAALLVGANASPTPGHVVHERRIASSASRWAKRDKLMSSTVLPMKIGLRQSNLHRADEYIMDVSDPQSPHYGRHWSAAQVAQTFAPSQDTVEAVQRWLVEAKIPAERHAVSSGRGWIHFNATVAEAERLLATEYFFYEHEDSGDLNVACDSYSVPSVIREHIDLIIPTVHFNNKINSRHVLRARQTPTGSTLTPPLGTGNASDITQCVGNAVMLPSCIRALYAVPDGDLDIQAPNSFGITEYAAITRQSDLDIFMNYTMGQVGEAPILYSIDGGNASTLLYYPPGVPGNLIEPDLDLEYAMALVYPLNVTEFAVGDYILGGTPDLFLDAIDGSYCNFDGGDVPGIDPAYPDTYNQPGAYNHTRECGTLEDAITNVISTSYAENENLLTAHYMTRQCYEYMKLGLRGVTLINSSGDGGVEGNSDCARPGGTISSFQVTFPNTCPYITSVGGSMVRPNTSVTDPSPEVAGELVDDTHQFKSCGGFSTLFPIPEYQQYAIATYWEQHAPNVSVSITWNNSQTTRGIPDVAFNALNYVTVTEGFFQLITGTSASAPGFASLIARINQARLNVGKKVVGFLNPVIYANPHLFTDITGGDNQCANQGFLAVEGWDPVTGLGTPKFGDLMEFFLSMP